MGVYRGMSMTLLRDVPGYFAYFGKFYKWDQNGGSLMLCFIVCYEGFKRIFQSMRNSNEVATADLLMAGGLAGLAAWVPSYPQDVIKSCYQNDSR